MYCHTENVWFGVCICTLHYRTAVYYRLYGLYISSVECTINDSTCLITFEKSSLIAQKCAILSNVLKKMYYYKIVHAYHIFKICYST